MNQLEREFVEYYAKLAHGFGMGDLLMRIFGLLYLEPKEMALDVIAKKTGYSLASISTAMKTLETAGIVLRKKKPGSKKAYFYSDRNLLRMNVRKLTTAQNTIVEPAKTFMPEMLDKYKNSKDKKIQQQLTFIKSYYKQMLEFEDIMKRWTKELKAKARKY